MRWLSIDHERILSSSVATHVAYSHFMRVQLGRSISFYCKPCFSTACASWLQSNRSGIRTCSSPSSLSTYVSGQLFSCCSMSITTCCSMSITFILEACSCHGLVEYFHPWWVSYKPPHHGNLDSLNCQVICCLAKLSCNSSLFRIFLIHAVVVLKAAPLSDTMRFGLVRQFISIQLLLQLIHSLWLGYF